MTQFQMIEAKSLAAFRATAASMWAHGIQGETNRVTIKFERAQGAHDIVTPALKKGLAKMKLLPPGIRYMTPQGRAWAKHRLAAFDAALQHEGGSLHSFLKGKLSDED
jgi:hypothetical protein